MNTLGLSEASTLLKMHPQTVLRRVRSGDIPAAKLGKCWVFVKEDLVEWIRSHYTRPQQDVGQGGKLVCSLKDQTANTGGIALQHQTVQQYANLLKLKTRGSPKN